MTLLEIPPWGRYAELHPDELAAILAAAPAAYVPWGALEWHGPHLPLGLDGLVAENVATRAAALSGGVILPTTWWAITTLPHAHSITAPPDVVVSLWRNTFHALAGVGFRVIALITGHYAQAHDYLLMQAADEAMRETGALIITAPELAVLDGPPRLDHAALWETSSLLAIRPDLVRLDRLDAAAPSGDANLARYAVLGGDPRLAATPALGETTLSEAAIAWAGWVRDLLADPDAARVQAFHARRRARLQPYVDRYYAGDWEAAIHAWWQDRLAGRV